MSRNVQRGKAANRRAGMAGESLVKGSSEAYGLGYAQIEARGVAVERTLKQKPTSTKVVVVSEKERLIQTLLSLRRVPKTPAAVSDIIATLPFSRTDEQRTARMTLEQVHEDLLRGMVAAERESIRLTKLAQVEAAQAAIAEQLAAERLARRTALGMTEEQYTVHLSNREVRRKRDEQLRAHCEEVRLRNAARARAALMVRQASLVAKLRKLAPAFRRYFFVMMPKLIAERNAKTLALIASQEARLEKATNAAFDDYTDRYGMANCNWGDAMASDHVIRLEDCIANNRRAVRERLAALEVLQPKHSFLKFDRSRVEHELPKVEVQALPAYLAPVVIDRSREEFTGIIVRNLRKIDGYGELRTVCDQLKRVFEAYGPLTAKNGVYVPMDKYTQLSKGYAFINFTSWRAASAAYDTLNCETGNATKRMLPDPKTGVLREMMVELAAGQAKDSETMARVTKERAAAKAAEKAATAKAEECRLRALAKSRAAAKPCEGVTFEPMLMARAARVLDDEEFPSMGENSSATVMVPKFSFAAVAAIVPTEVGPVVPEGKVLVDGELYDDVAYLRAQFEARLAAAVKPVAKVVEVVDGWEQ